MLRTNPITRFLMGTVMSLALAAPAVAADTYVLDASHTAVLWHISHFGFSSPSGKFMHIEGTLTLDEANPAASKIQVMIPVASVDSGVPKLDEHIKGKEFFDVATFPTATYKSDTIEVTGKDSALVHGTLTLHGVSKPVTLNVRLNKLAENMMKKKTAGFSASAVIKRSDFGMKAYLPGLGDDVRIEIESEANLAVEKSK
jgi:polyisoprenoid-binding protein YceI